MCLLCSMLEAFQRIAPVSMAALWMKGVDVAKLQPNPSGVLGGGGGEGDRVVSGMLCFPAALLADCRPSTTLHQWLHQ